MFGSKSSRHDAGFCLTIARAIPHTGLGNFSDPEIALIPAVVRNWRGFLLPENIVGSARRGT